ncbi:hypothetical protein AgCh_035339 [Apium graveolens]
MGFTQIRPSTRPESDQIHTRRKKERDKNGGDKKSSPSAFSDPAAAQLRRSFSDLRSPISENKLVDDDYGVPPEENTQGGDREGDGYDSEMDDYDA